MNIEQFWNAAFLAALTREPPAKAKEDADEATRLCIAQWQHSASMPDAFNRGRWQDQPIGNVPEPVCVVYYRSDLSPKSEASAQDEASNPRF